jgi:uncharacterized protein YuzE
MISYRYDQDADALDIRVASGSVARTVEIDTGTLVDVDEVGAVLSIEVIRPARRWPLAEVLEQFDIDSEDADMLRSLWGEPSYPFARPAELGSAAERVPA